MCLAQGRCLSERHARCIDPLDTLVRTVSARPTVAGGDDKGTGGARGGSADHSDTQFMSAFKNRRAMDTESAERSLS